MIIAIYSRPNIENAAAAIEQLFSKLEERNIGLMVHDDFYRFIKDRFKLGAGVKTFSSHEDIKGKAHFLLSIGGDGTLLETVAFVRNSVIPILGINTGRLGFLANVQSDEIDQAIHSL